MAFYSDRLSAGLVNPTPRLEVVEEKGAVVTLTGDNGPGPVVAVRAMELGIGMAAKSGIAAVAVRESNQPGMLSYYARLPLDKKMIGVAMTNDRSIFTTPGGSRPLYGANPVAIAVPTMEGRNPFVFESTTGSGDVKSYGAAIVVDILSGLLPGGAFGDELAGAEGDHPSVARIGHFFAAVHIESFGPFTHFRDRFDLMLKKIAFSGGTGPERGRYPGEEEYESEIERRSNGIPLATTTRKQLEGLARRFDIRDAWEQVLATRKT